MRLFYVPSPILPRGGGTAPLGATPLPPFTSMVQFIYSWTLRLTAVIAGLCEVCCSVDNHLMVFPAHKRGSLQLLVSHLS